MAKSNTTTVCFRESNIIINDNNYYHPLVIQGQPKAALLASAFTIGITKVLSGTLYGAGIVLLALMFELSSLTDLGIVSLIVGTLGSAYFLKNDIILLKPMDKEVLCDSYRFTFDFIKSKLFSNGVEITKNSQAEQTYAIKLAGDDIRDDLGE